MKKYLVLLKLQIKAAFMELPAVFTGTIVFAALMGLLTIGAVTFNESGDKDKSEETMKVAVVISDTSNGQDKENEYIKQAFEYLGKIDTVKNVCHFVTAEDESKAVKQLKKGVYSAVIVVPEKFISSIINGENRPARIIFAKEGATTNSAIFREMIRAGASDVSTAQAGVYALSDVFNIFPFTQEERNKAEMYLNTKYFGYAIDRNIYFEAVEVTKYGSLNIFQFYTVTGVILLLLLSGVTCVSLLKSDGAVLGASMKRFGVAAGVSHCFKVIGVSVVFWLIFGVVYSLVGLSAIRYPEAGRIIAAVGNAEGLSGIENLNPGWVMNVIFGLCGIFILMLSVFSFAGLVFKLADKTVSGVLLLFILSVVMMFISGCFIPVSMLPPIAAVIGKILPTAWMFKLCGQIFTGSLTAGVCVINLLYSAAFLAIPAMLERMRRL